MRTAARPRWSIPRPGPPLAEATRRGWTVTQVWNTHWHPDHTGGNVAVKAATGAEVSGPAAETIQGRDVALAEGDTLRIGSHEGRVIEIPGHTLGHIALVFEDARIAFVGDTLFAMGCGRVEGRRSRCTDRCSGWSRFSKKPRSIAAMIHVANARSQFMRSPIIRRRGAAEEG